MGPGRALLAEAHAGVNHLLRVRCETTMRDLTRSQSTPTSATLRVLAMTVCLVPAIALGSDGAHADPSAQVALALAVLLVVAKLGGHVAVLLKQPAVLGELLGGVLLGNVGLPWFEALETNVHLDMLARLGVLILLFEVGLESTVGQMLRVGLPSLSVAVIGVVVPAALGFGVARLLLPAHSLYVHAFVGATLSATSVGITARVLKDLGHAQSDEARIILGAAVIDDVLGLVLLSFVTALIAAADRGTTLGGGAMALMGLKAFGFLAGSLALGVWLSPHLFTLGARLRSPGVLLALGLGLCFTFAWLAAAIELAPIVGAFAAGLILENLHYRDFTDRGEHGLEELVHPIASFLVPIFFVLMGLRTDLAVFGDGGVLVLAVALTAVAILGKIAAGLGVRGSLDRLSIGLGMIPRGEVGLIFANIGLGLTLHGAPVVDAATYSALVVMVILTTLVTPPALTWSLRARARRSPTSPP